MSDNLARNNIVRLNSDSVYADIQSFLMAKCLRSENTRKAYEKDIRRFFKVTRNKDLEQLTREDLHYRHSEIVNYQTLMSETFTNTTVNRLMTSVRSLFDFLSRDYDEIRPEVFKVDRLPEDSVNRGILNYDEAMQLIDVVKQQRKGLEKSLLVEMAIKTSLRLSALLSLTWDDIKPYKHYYVVSVIDKGNKRDEKPISADFYQRLQMLRRIYNDDYVFHLNKKTCNNMIDMACKELGIPPERNITFHSLKNVAINFVLDTTGDVRLAAQQGNHSNVNTTIKHYAKKKDFEEMPGLVMDGDIDLSVLENMNKEDLIGLIQKLSVSAKSEIAYKAKRKEE